MHQKGISILFYLIKARINKKGVCAIYCRITFLGKRKQFATGEFIDPSEWSSKNQVAIESKKQNIQVNAQLEIIRTRIKSSYLKLRLEDEAFTVDDIFRDYLGKEAPKEEQYLIAYFNAFLSKLKKLIGIEIQEATWIKYQYVRDYTADFIKWKFKKQDYLLTDITLQFVKDFEYFLKTQRSQDQVTINKCIQRLRRPIREAYAEQLLPSDPFILYKPRRVKKEVVFLTKEELQLFEKHSFSQPRLQTVKNLFIFCCYTGLAYNEMKALKREHIQLGFDGAEWIKLKRSKTGKLISLPLLPKAKELIQFYDSESEYLLPQMSNQKINSYLKEIAGILGIKKRITHHTARKTFASTVLLNNDVPMEIVSELLGHSSIKITQEYYGKIVQKRISDEMKRISKIL
ncbi:site-specific integrase [Robiginitalea sp. SC105]|uniref:site-specific integrase n=1 Tax=Robiginitalea sp. SC105 TaxID=2762332 RepID=UPI00163A3B49|nr:site-specific integrase [Robiginitalea sp. SC105]MBC2840122.1 site-specific integrase [Robiginitalea sp. SC105]